MKKSQRGHWLVNSVIVMLYLPMILAWDEIFFCYSLPYISLIRIQWMMLFQSLSFRGKCNVFLKEILPFDYYIILAVTDNDLKYVLIYFFNIWKTILLKWVKVLTQLNYWAFFKKIGCDTPKYSNYHLIL